MIPGLRHEYASVSDDKFFTSIDVNGGWPVGFKFVGFEHTTERAAGFCNSPQNDGWWTVVASADDYYLWKLSPARLQEIANAVRSSICLSNVDASKLHIRNFMGFRAELAKQS